LGKHRLISFNYEFIFGKDSFSKKRDKKSKDRNKKKSGELLAEKSFTEWQIRSQPF